MLGRQPLPEVNVNAFGLSRINEPSTFVKSLIVTVWLGISVPAPGSPAGTFATNRAVEPIPLAALAGVTPPEVAQLALSFGPGGTSLFQSPKSPVRIQVRSIEVEPTVTLIAWLTVSSF